MVVANAMVGSRSWIGGLLYRYANKRNGEKTLDYSLSPLQVKSKF